MSTREETVKYLGGNPYTDIIDMEEIGFGDYQWMMLKSKNFDAYVWENRTTRGWYTGVLFTGKSTKKVKPIRFPSYDSALRHIESCARVVLNKVKAAEDAKIERKLNRNNLISAVKPGAILYTSYGYDQTNVYFYQVVEKYKTKFTLREIKQYKTYDTPDNGTTKPIPDSFVGVPFDVGVNGHGFRINENVIAKPLEFKFDESGNRVYDPKPFSNPR